MRKKQSLRNEIKRLKRTIRASIREQKGREEQARTAFQLLGLNQEDPKFPVKVLKLAFRISDLNKSVSGSLHRRTKG
jgi:hypothetical protein